MNRDAVHLGTLWSRRHLLFTFIRRDVEARYRGSVLGVLWSLLLPLAILLLFTFIFSTVMQVRWGGRGGEDAASFAELVFAGMIVFMIFSDVVSRAPTLVLGSANLVTKVPFPLEILPAAAVGGALSHAAVSCVALLAVKLMAGSPIHLTILLVPFVLAPFALMVLGIAYMLAAIGVFFRDTSQITQAAVMALMFASPLFYPMAALPEPYRTVFGYNPLVWPIESLRALATFGAVPDLASWAFYTSLALLVAAFGLELFQRMRPGFADVL